MLIMDRKIRILLSKVGLDAHDRGIHVLEDALRDAGMEVIVNTFGQKPEDIVEKRCYFGRTEYFIKGTENTANCSQALFGTTPTPTP